jgi:ketosteroid isomerase-like protein
MKLTILFAVATMLVVSCNQKVSRDELKSQVFNTEKAFEKMTAEKGAAEAFSFYADDSAVIKRAKDTLIIGKENIRDFYLKQNNTGKATVTWTPDFIETSEDGTLAYTYGRYQWVVVSDSGDTSVYKGVFHTVWERQGDGSWRYVWD